MTAERDATGIDRAETPLVSRSADMADFTAAGCCPPLAREPLTAEQAVELVRVFKGHG